MKNKSLLFLFPLSLLVLLVLGFSTKIGSSPAIGNLLNPFVGVVQNERAEFRSGELDVAGNRDIKIVFDDRSVPHIFTDNDDDMYFAQGYVTASDRLWQMDFISYVSGGRMAEIFGEDYTEYDREQRRLGMLESAKKSLKFIESNAQTKRALDNYTAGVNEYIKNLNSKDYPVEYKLLDYKPESWTNLKSVLIMKYMASMLSGYERDAEMIRLMLQLGEEDFNLLYPDYKVSMEESVSTRFHYALDTLPKQDYIDYSFLSPSKRINPSKHNPKLGSNAWAVSGDKTEDGNAMLCNDPHLGLTLPSIWYEVQLNSGETNVRGVSIPGVIGVVIGFNDNVSWGLTSGVTDVKDWFKLLINDDYSKYKYDGVWTKTKKVIEEIIVRGKESYFDTVYYTIHGPITYDDKFNSVAELQNHALKWTLHDTSNEFLSILLWNKAKNRKDFEAANKHFRSPVQNVLYADRKGNIARYYQGKVYKKEKGQGRFLLDGTTSDHLYSEVLEEELPKVVNPEVGYVSSANNNPFEQGNEHYVNGYFDELRIMRIKQLLTDKDQLSIADMKAMQLDQINIFAKVSLPFLLEKLEVKHKGKVAAELNQWDYSYDIDSKAAVLFEKWWDIIEEFTWDENAFLMEGISYPDRLTLHRLMTEMPSNKYFDRVLTNKVESFEDIVRISFAELERRTEKDKIKEWRKFQKVEISHLTKIRSFGEFNLKVGGSRDCLNAQSETWGPSWRMIVKFTSNGTKAFGVNAGGQSGNVAVQSNNESIKKWEAGEYFELSLFKNFEEAKTHSKSILILK